MYISTYCQDKEENQDTYNMNGEILPMEHYSRVLAQPLRYAERREMYG